MAALTSSLVVRLIDQVTRPARSVSNSLLGIRRAGESANQVRFGDRLASSMRRNEDALANARGGLVDAAAGFFALKTAIAAPVREAMLFESAMADVRKVVDFPTPQAFNDFRDGLMDLSKQVPISVNGLAAIAAAAGQAGIAGDDLNKFTEAAAKVGVAFDITADQAGDSMAKMMTGLGLSIDETILLTDAMNHLSNAQASSAAEILDVVRRVGAQGTMFGFTAEETAAFGSAMVAAGAQSDVAATSFMNMGRALVRGEGATKRQSNAFRKLGLDAGEVSRAMQEDAVATTIDVMERIAELPAHMRATVSSDLFGDEARALGPLLTNLDLVRDSMAMVADESEYAGSSFKEFEVRAGTFENALQIFQNRLSAMKVVIGAALIPAINSLMDSLTPVIEGVTSFAQAHPQLISNVLAATAAVIGFRVALSALKFAGLLGRGGALSMLALGFNTVGRASIHLARAASSSVALQAALAGMSGAKLTGLDKVSAALRGLAGATGLTAIGSALTAITGAVAAISAPVWLGIAVAVAALGAAWRYWDRVAAIARGVASAVSDKLAPAMARVREWAEPLMPILRRFAAAWQSVSDGIDAAAKSARSVVDGLFTRESLSGLQSSRIEGSAAAATGALLGGGDAGTPSGEPYMSARDRGWSPGRAKGGPVGHGKTHPIGEDGMEIATFGRTGYVQSAQKTAEILRRASQPFPGAGQGGRSAGGRGGSITINAPVTIHGVQDIRGAAEEIGRMIENQLSRAMRGAQFDVEGG
jgi:TP901 family phage tail tape measure protein